MTFLSVCSGIEAASVAWRPLSWHATAFSEIDRFPCAVLAHHYPDTPNLGDMTKHHEWPDLSVDLVVGGTPCQAFSVAGLRGGLEDPRGNLTLGFLGVVSRYRPKWVVWENVPGVRSDASNAFGQFIAGLAELGYYAAWRSLDAQYFGLAQRRERVFVVAHLGDWRRAAAVLFERESLSGDSPPSRETGEGTAPTLAARTRDGGGLGTDFDCDGGLIAASLRSSDGPHGHSWGLRGDGGDNLVTHSLRADGHDASEDGTGRGTPLVPVCAPCLTGNYGKQPDSSDTSAGPMLVAQTSSVRRLTPRECERLQGFPDDYTLVPYRGKPACDGPRYKALGNSMAVPVMRWIGERIQLMEKRK